MVHTLYHGAGGRGVALDASRVNPAAGLRLLIEGINNASFVLLCPETHIHHMRSPQSGLGKWDSFGH